MIIEPDEVNPHDEPCVVCGEETAVGSVFFSDRREAQLPDGTRGFVCSECIRQIRAHGHHEGLREGRLVEGSAIALVMAVR
jgi:hypothetical protein